MGSQCGKKFRPTPQLSSPYPKRTSTLEDLETDMDDNMVDITDFFERPPNEKRSHRPEQTNTTQSTTQEQCPTPQNSPTYIPMKTPTAAAVPTKNPIEPKFGEFFWIKERYPVDGQHVSEGSHPW